MLLWAHGLEGKPHGHKVASLWRAGLIVLAPDFAGLSLARRVELLERITGNLVNDCERRLVLAGSSYGGLAAALVAAHHPDRLKGLLLLAPALGLDEPPNDDPQALAAPPGVPTIILHGADDVVVPLADSRDYAARSGDHVMLRELDDDHMLHDSIPAILAAARELGA